MDTPVMTPQTSVRPAGNAAGTDAAPTDAAATGFAALLALELESFPALADGGAEHDLAMEDGGDAQAGNLATAPSFAADPLASLQLPAVPPPSPPPVVSGRGITRSATDAPAEIAARTGAAPAKSAGGGNFSLPAAIAGQHSPDADLPDRSAAVQEMPAQPAGHWQSLPVAPQNPASPAGAAAAAAMPRIEVPVAQPGWSEAFAQRVLLMAGKQQQSAELHLNPPELGPVSIVLSMDNDLANVFFSSPLVPVREAIENAMPTLREALGQAGIQLGETGVSAESFRRDTDARGQDGLPAAAGRPAGEGDPRNDPAHKVLTRHPGLVDTFA